MSRIISMSENIRRIFAAIRSVPVPLKPGAATEPQRARPFITISRQAGAGGWTLAQQLVESFNAADPSGDPWTCWDRELVGKVAADSHISQRLVESLEDSSHHWLSECLNSLSFSDTEWADEDKVYRRVATAIRALAQAGRVVIVGRGGVFITRRMPGGIHVRLVAPLEQRIDFMVRQYNMSHKQASAHVAQLDRNRHAFYHRYWPNESLAPETFAITVNTAAVDIPTMVQIIQSLVKAPVPA